MSQEAILSNNTSRSSLQIDEVDISSLSEKEHKEHLAFNNTLRAESHPDDPPRTLEAQIANWSNLPAMLELHKWVVRDTVRPGNPIIATGELNFHRQGSNQHAGDMHIKVLPERRRKGIARLLLPLIAATAREKNRTVLMAGTNDLVPAGAAFLQHLGAEPGLSSHVNQLVLADLDRVFLRTYRDAGERRGKEAFELIRCDSPVAEELLIPVTELANTVANDIPHGNLDRQPFHFTPEQVREMERIGLASGTKNLALVARERKTGKPVGLTMLFWDKHNPYMVSQGITGVLPDYRGRGLARTLKATLLEQLLEEYPGVKFVRTDNADSNVGMLAINTALGFRPYRSETYWQIPTERVFAYLAAS